MTHQSHEMLFGIYTWVSTYTPRDAHICSPSHRRAPPSKEGLAPLILLPFLSRTSHVLHTSGPRSSSLNTRFPINTNAASPIPTCRMVRAGSRPEAGRRAVRLGPRRDVTST